MVFCYKLITESPRRSGIVSPRKSLLVESLPVFPSSISQLINSLDYNDYESTTVLDSVPEREWRLLAAMARKREGDNEREKLAEEVRKLWQEEKIARDIVQAETSDQYKRYLHKKREEFSLWTEYRKMQISSEQQIRRNVLLENISQKEKMCADRLAWCSGKKETETMRKAIGDEVRWLLAAERRTKQGEAEHWRKRVELLDGLQRVDEARRRRRDMLKDASQRVAINNALSTWESTLVRKEVTAMEAARRATFAASAALTDARRERLARERCVRVQRARRVAAFTKQLRDAMRSGRI